MCDEAFINCIEIFDSKTTVLLRLADVFPGMKCNRIGGVVILNASPPKSSNDRVDFLHKSLREENLWTCSKQE
jgi:hypothetical protein